MKIVHAVRSDAFAGVERHIAVLARAQAELGDDVSVIGGDPDKMKVELGPDVLHRRAATASDVAAGLARWRRHDVVHAHMTAAEAAAALVPGRRPLVVTRHFAARRGASWAGRLAAPLLRRRVGRQIAVSRFVARAVDGPSTVIYAGVPERALSTTREPLVLVCQRLEPEKQTGLALRAFARSGLVEEGWRLVIAGCGSESQELNRWIEQLGIRTSVDMVGFSDDVPALMDQASIFLATAPAEPFGLSVVEAMSSGLPVVASASGGHLESVGSVDAPALYKPGDAQEAGMLLRDLTGDAWLRKSYGERLQRIQRQSFTPQRQALETRALYEELH